MQVHCNPVQKKKKKKQERGQCRTPWDDWTDTERVVRHSCCVSEWKSVCSF